MFRFLLPVGFALALGAVPALPAPPAAAAPPTKPDEELVEKVRTAIDAGVRYLKKQQSSDGNWEGIVINFLADMEGGSTGLVTLALLNCGVKPDDPGVARAIEYLRKLPPKKTYVVALCNMVMAETRDKRYVPEIQRNADWLIKNALGWKTSDDGKVLRVTGQLQGWSYPQNQMSDNSNTQYALLGLYAAKSAGATIHNEVWQGIQEYYTRTQVTPEEAPRLGFWTYYNEKRDLPSISMSVAGVCGLLIARMGLDVNEHELDPASGVAKNCGVYGENTALAKGLNWVAENFSFESPKSTYYNIYGMERLGRLSGQRFIGTHDWYREGCEKLVGKFNPNTRKWEKGMQADDGSFGGGRQIDGTPHLSTAFSLLFLSKGRTPVLVSKFAWGDFQARGDGLVEVAAPGHPAPAGGSNWNRKHNDTRHIVEFCSRELFDNAPLSWQVYDARRLDFVNDGGRGRTGKEKLLDEVGLLLQSPILYLNGHGPLILTPAQEEILKTYIEEGGFVVAEACCGDPAFAASFRKLMKKLFPDNTLRKMPPEHAIWKMFPGIVPTDFPEIEVLDRGCRSAAVFSPVPLAGYWEEAKYMPQDSRHPKNRGEKAYCLIRNIVGYATGMEMPKPKLSRQVVFRGTEAGVTRSHFKAAQLKIEGGGDPPAPDALKNLMGYLRDNARLEVALKSVVLEPYSEDLFNFKFMYLHGRKLKDDKGGPLYRDADVENIQSNLLSGGLLLADAACNGYEQWKAFDQSFRELCTKLFPDRKLEIIQERLPDGREDPLFRIARESGINIKSVRCRRELANDGGPEPEMRTYPVHLEGIKIDGRWVVIYSKYDIGCAIEGHKAADCLGHDKDSALRIASAVVLYALKR
jgi:hypothetical protein